MKHPNNTGENSDLPQENIPEKRKGYGKVVFEHKYSRRKKNHDYSKPATYHIILHKEKGCCEFGELTGDPRIIPGNEGCARIDRSSLGWVIEKEIFRWADLYPILKIYQHIVMPDHVHILVRVREKSEKKFGFYVNMLKGAIKMKWNDRIGRNDRPVFEEGFTDKIIFPSRSLDAIIQYIRTNPHRLAIRRNHPEFFHRIRNIKINGETWQAYGNPILLRNPFKMPVIVHRRDSEDDRAALLEDCLENAKEGGVAVSAFISEGEKKVRDALIDALARIIHVQEKPFGDRFKPEKSRFEQCCQGNLLILAPMEPLNDPSRREECLHLNKIAEAVAADEFVI